MQYLDAIFCLMQLKQGVPYNGRLCTTADYVQRPVVHRPLYNGRWTTAPNVQRPWCTTALWYNGPVVQRPWIMKLNPTYCTTPQLKDQNKNNKLKLIILCTFLLWPHSKRKYFCLYRCFLLLSAWEWVPVDVAVQDRQSWHNLNRCTLHINFSHWETAHKMSVRFLHPDQWHFLGLLALVNLRLMSLVFKTELSAQLEQMLKLRFFTKILETVQIFYIFWC